MKINSVWTLFLCTLVIGCVTALPAAAGDAVDAIYTNGKIYTVNAAQPWAQAVAIKDGRYFKVGSNEEVSGLKGDDTRVIDLNGRFVMPGMLDEHIHPDMGADNYLNVFVYASDSWDVVTKTIQDYRRDNPDKQWIYGGNLSWLMDNGEPIADSDVLSHKSALDEIVADRAIALWDQGVHAMLLNSKALELLGIDHNTPDPAGGIIVRDAKGEATGVLREKVCTLVTNALDNPAPELWTEKGMKPFLDEMTAHGIIGMNDVFGVKRNLDAYRLLQDRGELNVYMNVSIATPLEFNDKTRAAEQDQLIRNRKDYASELIRPNAVKYLLDGSAAGRTAVMLEPFIGTDFRGDLRYP